MHCGVKKAPNSGILESHIALLFDYYFVFLLAFSGMFLLTVSQKDEKLFVLFNISEWKAILIIFVFQMFNIQWL